MPGYPRLPRQRTGVLLDVFNRLGFLVFLGFLGTAVFKAEDDDNDTKNRATRFAISVHTLRGRRVQYSCLEKYAEVCDFII